MGVITNYKEAVQELFYWQYCGGKGSSFNMLVFHLIQKAQITPVNMRKLEIGFPHEVAAMRAWDKAGNSGNDLFAEHGIVPEGREQEFTEGLANTYKEKKGKTDTENFNSWAEQQRKENDK